MKVNKLEAFLLVSLLSTFGVLVFLFLFTLANL